MVKKRNKVLILFVALIMFTFTWAGVFAEENPAAPGEGPDTPQANELDVANDNATVNEESEAPSVDAEAPVVDDEAKGETAAKVEGKSITVNSPTATVSGSTITLTWDAVVPESETDVVTYTVTEKFNSKEVTEPVYSGKDATCTLENKAAGKYAYKVAVKVNDEAKGESDFSAEVEVLPAAPAKIETIKALSGCDCVVLTWQYTGKADGFIIYRFDSESDFNNNVNARRINPNGSKYIVQSGNTWTWTNSVSITKEHNYWYKVCAVNKKGNDFNEENIIKSEPAVIMDKGCVRPMYITLKLKKNRTLKSLNGGPRIKLKKNATITANGFGGGCYYFTYNGKKYRMARSSAKKQKALYNGRGNWDYTPEEAELFVKQAGLKSKTNYLIWVSFYTQRMYFFKKDGGEWKCVRDWDCATGKASTPSPTGDKAIGKKKKSHHNIKWWSSFSNPKSIANSIHGKKKGWKLGLPQSHGCIRNEVANAKFIYDTCPKNTKVYNY